MKNLTTDLTNALNTTKGIEPIVVLGINWGPSVGNILYADKTLTGPLVCQGKILKVSNLSVVRQHDVFGEIGSCNVELDDSDLHFWNIMNVSNLEGRSISVYQYFPNVDPSELIILFIGNIVGPIDWSEGNRTLSFSIFTHYNDADVGQTITSDDLLDDFGLVQVLDKNAIGQMVPLSFGNCLKTKALRTFTGRQSTLLENLEFDDKQLHDDFFNDLAYSQISIGVDLGNEWPQKTGLYIIIDDMKFLVIFNNDTMTVIDSNIPTDLALAKTYRDPVDPDYDNPKVTWIPTNEKLTNKWIWFNDPTYGNIINFCTSQNGQKCTFQNPMLRETPDYTSDDNNFVIKMNGAFALQTAVKFNYKWPKLNDFFNYFEEYVFPVGTVITADVSDYYKVNQLTGCSVKQLYAYREIPNAIYNPEIDQYEQRGSTRKLCIIPSSYYTINTSIDTSVSFDRKLKSYPDQYWDESEIFVTQSSTVGPNTSDIIKWLIQNYTSLQINLTSFNSVKTKIDKYPSNFTLYDSKKAIELCREIAWQARCALRVFNGTVYLLYLSELPTSIYSVSNDKLIYKTLSISYTDTERMYTRAKVKFKKPSLNIKIKDEQLYVFENNIPAYGLKEIDWDFFIYDEPDYVIKSAEFWLTYYSNSWKKVKVKGFLPLLVLEVFDCVTVQSLSSVFPLGIASCRAIVEETSYDSENFQIDFSFWLPLLSGTQIEFDAFWLNDSDDGISFIDRTYGLTPLDYDVDVATSQSKKHPKKYAKVVSINEELDKEGTPTGKKTYTVKAYEHGLESGVEDAEAQKARALSLEQTELLVGDIVETQVLGNQVYLDQPTLDPVIFIFVSMGPDYVIGKVKDGDGTFIPVAKQFNNRRTPFDTLTVDGISYTYSDDVTRLAHDGVNPDETQQLTPDFIEDITEFKATRNTKGLGVVGPGGVSVGWLMDDSYQWAVE